MKKIIPIILFTTLVCTGYVFAQQTQLDLKWSQTPDMTANSTDIYDVNPTVLADDWVCTNGLPITDIHWWGSYLLFDEDVAAPVNTPLHPDTFLFSQHLDVPNDANNQLGYSYPGQQINSASTLLGQYAVSYFGSIDHGTYFEHVYEYTFNLSQPWTQTEGQIYWLDISAQYTDPNIATPWGWHTAEIPFNDAAVINGIDVGWIPYDGTTNLAFALSTAAVPEPGAMMLFAFGGILWIFKKLKK